MIYTFYQQIESHLTDMMDSANDLKISVEKLKTEENDKFKNIYNINILKAKAIEFIEAVLSPDFVSRKATHEFMLKIKDLESYIIKCNNGITSELGNMIQAKIHRDSNPLPCDDNMDFLPEKTGIRYIDINWTDIAEYTDTPAIGERNYGMHVVETLSAYTINSLVDKLTNGILKNDIEEYCNYMLRTIRSALECCDRYTTTLTSNALSCMKAIDESGRLTTEEDDRRVNELGHIKSNIYALYETVGRNRWIFDNYFKQWIVITRAMASNFKMIYDAYMIYCSEDNIHYTI